MHPAHPETLSRSGLRRVLATLCITVTVSYGVLYYAFPVLLTSIASTTGWSTTFLTAAFSGGLLLAAILGVPVGRWLDRHGPRTIMTGGSVIGTLALVLIAVAPNRPLFATGWVVAGAAMAAVFYPPAFTTLTRWYSRGERVRALTMLTLAAGLASTIFAPLTAFLLEHLGWGRTYLALAAILAAVTVPAHWWGLRGRWPGAAVDAVHGQGGRAEDGQRRHDQHEHDQHDRAERRPHDHPARISRSLPFLALATALGLTSLVAFAVIINLVPMMEERGMSTSTAALALGLGGFGQVIGRLCFPALTRWTGVRLRTALILLAVALTTALLGVLTTVTTLIGASIAAGIARGLVPLLQATAVSERWGTAHYGRLTGQLSAPITVTMALSPWFGSAIADLLGGYTAAFLALAGVGIVATAVSLLSAPRTQAGKAPAG
ncbi:MFS transporter [Phytoactinopolyspora halotolerans]|uniref:MFS transporter n=1 Tax=Phytoactinopolyspora halotolerans TaxID=1981512 RepID=A0A6L9SE42_9ACTN|nr:MFS transporter [Phytoactinopolyspora halotolerans]